jgi:hydrogenase maturation protein HypF
LEIAIKQATQKINAPVTSSTGRVLDSLATLFHVCYQRTYEGEPAIRFESFANKGKPNPDIRLQIPTKPYGKTTVLDTSTFIKTLIQHQSDFNPHDIALASHHALGQALADLAIQSAQEFGITKIGFSGGVAYNKILTNTIRSVIEKQNLTCLIHDRIPAGDAGTSVGQSLVARSNIQ